MQIQKSRLRVATVGIAASLALFSVAAHAHNVGTCHSHADEGVCEDDGSAGTSSIDSAAMNIFASPSRPTGTTQGITTFGAKNSIKLRPRRKKRGRNR